jgi:hypothetical protein
MALGTVHVHRLLTYFPGVVETHEQGVHTSWMKQKIFRNSLMDIHDDIAETFLATRLE